MKRFLITCIAGVIAAGVAQANPLFRAPYDRPQSLNDIRLSIAWYGAACVRGASEIEVRGDAVSLESLAAETGVSLEQVQIWAAARDAEHDIAVDVLLRGGEPLRDPPEPFLTILRQGQSDCQDFERSRNVLQAAVDRGTMPEDIARPASGLRPEIEPLPFDTERRRRLEYVIRGVDEALAAGDFAADVEALLRVVSGRDEVTLDDLSDLRPIYALMPDTDDVRAMATDLLLPNPDQFTDLTGAELDIIFERIGADPLSDYGRYYVGLLLVNADQLSDEFVFVFRNEETGEVAPSGDAEYPPEGCHRVAGSAALACPLP